MTIAEGVSGRVVYKAYATGVITSGTEPAPATDPASSGGRILRRVSTTLALGKDAYQSNEVRSDRQIADFRHGVRRVGGNIAGELSPATYFDFIEAAHRDTATAAVSLDETDLTSVTSDASGSQFVFGGGDPVSLGLRVGDIIRFTGLATTANNSRNFLITGFGGTSNRTVTVTPAPTTDAVADTAFGVSRPGKASIVPASSYVSRKFAFEIWNQDIDVARLFTECRITGYRLGLPATGMSTIELMAMGRNVQTYTAGDAPFFGSPTAATTTGICAAVNGVLRAGGAQLGVVTGLDIALDLAATSDPVVGQNIVPEIFLGRANVSGTITAFFEDLTLFNAFKDETESEVLVRLDASSGAAADAIAIYLPRVKFGGGDISNAGEGGQTITLPFQALKYEGAGAGIAQTTIRIHDTAAS